MNRRRPLINTLLAALFCFCGLAPSAHAGGGSDEIEFQLMVCIGQGHSIDEVITALEPLMESIEIIDQVGENKYLVEFEYDLGSNDYQLWMAVVDLFQNGVIVWGDNNFEAQAPEGRTDSLWFTGLAIGVDAFETQYARDVIGSDAAIPLTSGQGAIVAVIDTGIDPGHPLFGRQVVPGWDFLTSSSTLTDPNDGIDNDGDGLIDEMAGHGSFVASMVRLAARDASIMPLRVLNSDGVGNQFRVSAAIDWAVSHGADVINLSLGSNGASQAVAESIFKAKQAGVAVVCAIGNAAMNNETQYPASDPNAFAVAATDTSDVLANFSNFGPDVFVCAPGQSNQNGGGFVLEESIVGAIPGGGYAIWSGSSFSTGLTSGLAANVRAQHPEWPNFDVQATEVADAVMTVIAQTAVNIDAINPAIQAGWLGHGRIDALAAAQSGPSAPMNSDLNGDGLVDGLDLTLFLTDWGGCLPGACLPDINRDSLVDGADLAELFSDWN